MDKVTVNAAALRKVLTALMGPEHLIKELLVIHGLHFHQVTPPDSSNPIGTLINEYNAAVEEETKGAWRKEF